MDLNLIKKLCCLKESTLRKELVKFLYSKKYKVKYTHDYILAEGDIPICLIAHMDTVFKHKPTMDNFLYDNTKKVLWVPYGAGFDDRAGIYAIMQILSTNLRPHIIFTNGEEIGGIGATALINKYKKIPFSCKMIIELDRTGKNDAVFYNCDNIDFMEKIESFGFEINFGTFTDISIIAPAWGVAAVNLSVGYLDEHSGMERLYCNWTDGTIKKVIEILSNEENFPYYEYIPFINKTKYANDILSYSGYDGSCLLCGEHNILKLNYVDQKPCPFYLCDECLNKYYGGKIG